MLINALIAALAATAIASPSNVPHYVHEKRAILPQGWSRLEPASLDTVIPMKVALTQSNLDLADNWLNEISHPDSPTYGQHWSAAQIAEAFAPRPEAVEATKAWLASAGISLDRVKQSQSLGFLQFEATVAEAQNLLQTKYHSYVHENGQPRIACEEYSIPVAMQEHIDFVYPTLHFDGKLRPSENTLEKRGKNSLVPLGSPGSASLPKLGSVLANKNSIIQQLTQCDQQIVPNCLRLLYEFPPNFQKAAGNSFGVVEYTPQAYVPSDLDMFFRNFSARQVGNRPILDSIDGGTPQQTNMGFGYNGESDLDFEYAMTLVYPQNVTLYQTGDTVEGASFNNFLDAIDASYCTYEGGNNANYDAEYPDPDGGYQGPNNCGGFAATKVISTSYAYNEADLTPAYEQRQCNEYMKLGMMGVTVVYSSGDYGVAGNQGQCINGTGYGENATYIPSADGGRFNPSFPGTCPYITAVGATQVIANTSVPKAIASGTQPEMACETVIYSGGGFSNVFPIPSYQKTAQANYFAKYNPPYTSAKYNNSRQVRGLPDVSANGANYVIAVDGQFALVYGTSAAAPVFASIITLINQERILQGKSTVGFINPVIYANPSIFNDVTQGNNPGCATNGFSAVPGWDPVTGLGTPNFPRMLRLWLNLK